MRDKIWISLLGAKKHFPEIFRRGLLECCIRVGVIDQVLIARQFEQTKI